MCNDNRVVDHIVDYLAASGVDHIFAELLITIVVRSDS